MRAHEEVEPMSDRYYFDAARWISDAFQAGIFARVNSNGDLALDVVNACPKATEELLGRLRGHPDAVILPMPKPDREVPYLGRTSGRARRCQTVYISAAAGQ